jgi:hypothetical protein
MQAEASGEDDAIAWAAGVAGSDSLKRVAGSGVSLGVSAAMGSLDSFPSAFLRLGSLGGTDSIASVQLLGALADMAEGGGQGIEGAGEEQPAGGAAGVSAEQA